MNENNVKFLQRMIENKDVIGMEYHPRYKNGAHPSPYFIHPKNNNFIEKEDHIKLINAFAKYSGRDLNENGGNDWIISPILDFKEEIIYPVKYGDKNLPPNYLMYKGNLFRVNEWDMVEIVPLFRHDGNGNKNNYRRVLGTHCYQSKLIKSNYNGIPSNWSLHHLDCNWKNNAPSNLVFVSNDIHQEWHKFIRQVLLPMIDVLIKEGEIDEED